MRIRSKWELVNFGSRFYFSVDFRLEFVRQARDVTYLNFRSAILLEMDPETKFFGICGSGVSGN